MHGRIPYSKTPQRKNPFVNKLSQPWRKEVHWTAKELNQRQ